MPGKPKDPARTAEIEGVDALMRASRIITAAVAHSLAAIDEVSVSMPQLRVLVMLASRGPMNLTSVAEGLGVNPSNASRTCDRLVTMGLLDRREDENDRRNVVLEPTAEGADLVDTVMRHRRTVLAQVVGRMPQDDRVRMHAALEAFCAAADEVAEEQGLSDGEGQLLRWLT